MTTQKWFHLQATNLVITPYQASSPCNTYPYVAIYAEVKDIPLAIKLSQSHIFISYLQPEEAGYIKTLLQEGKNMHTYNTYYFERFLCITPNKPYQVLFSVNMESRARYCYSTRKQGYKTLTEYDLFNLFFYLWSNYYDKLYGDYPQIVTKDSQYGFDAFPLEETRKDVSLYEDPYDVKTMTHLTLKEWVDRVHVTGKATLLQTLG